MWRLERRENDSCSSVVGWHCAFWTSSSCSETLLAWCLCSNWLSFIRHPKFPLFLRGRFQEPATLHQWIATSFSQHIFWKTWSILDEIRLLKSPGQPCRNKFIVSTMISRTNFDQISFHAFSFISKHGCAQDWSLKSIDGDASSTGHSCSQLQKNRFRRSLARPHDPTSTFLTFDGCNRIHCFEQPVYTERWFRG